MHAREENAGKSAVVRMRGVLLLEFTLVPSPWSQRWIERAAGRAGKKAGQHTFIRLHSAPVTQLLIVTSVPEKGCPLPQGDRATLLGIMNKQDYARWHSYQFYLSTGTVDPSIRPPGALDVTPPLTALFIT